MPEDISIKQVPVNDAPADERRAWLTLAFTASGVGEIVRTGGTRQTPISVEIVDLAGIRRMVRFDTEQDASRHGTLRAELIGQGGVRAEHITNAKVAGDAYFLMCSLARIIAPINALDELQERLDGYREDANRTDGWVFVKPELHRTVDALRHWPYSKRELGLWAARTERLDPGEVRPSKPMPPLFADGEDEWTSVKHLGTYVRHHDDEHSMTISDARLAAGVVELGGERRKVQAWDKTTRDRVHKIVIVLVRLPRLKDDPAYAEEGDA